MGGDAGNDRDQAQAPSEAELLRTWLAGRHLPCPVCGYSLHGITSSHCPECGATLELRVGSVDLRIGAWLVAVLAMALPLGVFGMFATIGISIYLADLLTAQIADVEDLSFGAVFTAIALAYAFLLVRLVRRRRRFWAKPRSAQRLAAWLYVAAGSVIIFVLLLGIGFG